MNVAWDMWNQGYKWHHWKGNEREQAVIVQLNKAILLEIGKGSSNILTDLQYLLEMDIDSYINKPGYVWLRKLEVVYL